MSSTPLSIAVLAHLHNPIASPFAGGLEMHTALMTEELTALGHQVTLFAKEGSQTPGSLTAVLETDFRFTNYPEGPGRAAQSARLDDAQRAALHRIRGGKFDVVINNSLSPLPHIEPPAVPMLTILHTPPLPRVTAVLGSPAWQASPRRQFVSVSAANARQWRDHLQGIRVIHNGIRLGDWRAGASHRTRTGTAVWAGRITPEKGLHVAIEAAGRAGMRIRFAGPISDEEYFARQIAPLLSRTVQHVGHLNHRQLAGFLGSGEVFIASPLWAEPFGLTTVEAMACGTPVAALPGGAMSEIIDDDGGVVSVGFSSADLSRAITLARGKDRTRVRSSADRFGADLMITRYERQLRELAAMPAQGPADVMAS